MPIMNPVTPERATPDNCQEVVASYAKYLTEQASPDFGQDPARATKVRGSIDWCESTLAYWMSFLLDQDGSTDPVTDEVRWQISQLREAYAATYEVPPIEERALKLAQSHAKRQRTSVRASVERQQARHTPVAAPQARATADDLETVLARAYGLTVEQYRAQEQEACPTPSAGPAAAI
jgi:hypothetical protein